MIEHVKLGLYTLNDTGISKEIPVWMVWEKRFEVTWNQIRQWRVEAAIHSPHSLFLLLVTSTGLYQIVQGSASRKEFYNFVNHVRDKIPDKEYKEE